MRKNYRRQGFTLLEVLVVMVIIGILVGVVTISIGSDSRTILENESSYLHKILKAMPEEAVLAKKEIGLGLNNNSAALLEYDDKTASWQPYKNGIGAMSHKLDKDIKIELEVEGGNIRLESSDKPVLVFYSSGEVTPFKMHLTLKDEKISGFIIRTGKSNEIILETEE